MEYSLFHVSRESLQAGLPSWKNKVYVGTLIYTHYYILVILYALQFYQLIDLEEKFIISFNLMQVMDFVICFAYMYHNFYNEKCFSGYVVWLAVAIATCENFIFFLKKSSKEWKQTNHKMVRQIINAILSATNLCW